MVESAWSQLGSMNRPYVTLKWAQTLDGQLATKTGDSRWITGLSARTAAHQLRAEHDALMVGIGTVLTDDPQLTVRLVAGRNPLRVILDSSLRLPEGAQLLHADGQTLIFAADSLNRRLDSREVKHAEVVYVPRDANGLDLTAVLAALADRGIESLMVEGGARVITAFLRAQLVDELAIFLAPKILGAGRQAVESLDIDRVEHALGTSNITYERLGDDLLVHATLTF